MTVIVLEYVNIIMLDRKRTRTNYKNVLTVRYSSIKHNNTNTSGKRRKVIFDFRECMIALHISFIQSNYSILRGSKNEKKKHENRLYILLNEEKN